VFCKLGGWLTRGFFLSIAATLFIFISFTFANAQRTTGINSTGTEGNEEIAGRVFFPPGSKSTARPVVKLQSLSSPELTGVTDRDGSFRFTTLRPDEYTIIVEGGDEYENATETVTIGNSGAVPAQGNPGQYAIPLVYQVHIYLKPKGTNTTGGTASTSKPALANVPAPARELFQQALKNARAGNHLKAIEQLMSAIAQAPRFALAYNELAVQYLKTGHVDQAVETLRDGLGINPDDFTLRLNYGIALLNQKKFERAETELRLATQKSNADSPSAGYYLGMALLSQEKYDAAQSAFESAIKNGGDKLALAHKYLGGIYWHNRRYRQAADELETYLKLEPNAPDAQKIRGTIKELRQKS
jgi:Flp pilus assembly protein TadD